MVLTIKDFKVQPYNEYCYRLAKRKGKKQWQTVGYYDSLEDASAALLDVAIRVDRTCVNIACVSRDAVVAGLRALTERVSVLGYELIEKVKNNNEGGER